MLGILLKSLLFVLFILLSVFIYRTAPSDLFVRRGLIGGLVGVFAGLAVLYLFSARRSDGELILLGRPSGALSVWVFAVLPFIMIVLTLFGAVVGRLVAVIVQRMSVAQRASTIVGMIIGSVMGAIAGGVVARAFDYMTLKDFQLELYGYYFVGCAAIIGATSGAIAGAVAGFTERET